MSPQSFPWMHLLAEEMRSDVRWRHLPPSWVIVLLILPVVAFLSWWAYRRERTVSPFLRLVMATLRGAALALFLVALFAPYMEISDTRVVRSHLIVLVDNSQSMATVDGYESEDARTLAKASGLSAQDVVTAQRIELAKRVLANEANGLLGSWTEDFRLHVFTFGAQAVPVVSVGETESDGAGADAETVSPAERVRRRLAEIRATDAATRIGQAVAAVCDTFKVQDEPVAGIIVISDGQENGTVVLPEQAGRKAAAMHVPVYTAGVGDPRSPKNIHVGNLRAKEVALARDDAVFEFGVRAKGLEGRRVKIEMQSLDASGRGRPLAIVPAEVVLTGGDKEQEVRFSHRFETAGLYSLKIGIPVQPEEKIKSDNYVVHTIRVIDRKIKVLYVESTPRFEFHFLSNALVRDVDTMRAHTILLEADPETPQKRTMVPGWDPLPTDGGLGLPPREALFEYDVVILGDVDWQKQLAPDVEKAREALHDLRDFVEKGGGLIMLAGPRFNPSLYRDTELQGLLPVVIDRDAERVDDSEAQRGGFNLSITPDGRESPIMNVAGDVDLSVRMWETHPDWRQYWSHRTPRAKTLAKVLAVSPLPEHKNPRYGPRPLIATMMFGRGRVLYIGIDDLWRLRKEAADRYFYRFYGEAVRFLATYKLLGGNKRFKILTDREQYAQDDVVRITLDVLDRDYEPSKAPFQTITIEMPGTEPGKRETIEAQIPADPAERGAFRKEIHATRPGEYRLRAETDDKNDQPPEKVFRVVESTIEGRDLDLDERPLRALSDASEGGRYLHLGDLPSLKVASKEHRIPTEKREEDLWDDWWILAAGVSLLAAEWLLRKRANLV